MNRRQLLTAAAGATGLAAAAKLAGHNGLLPPDAAGIYGPGTALTFAAQRLLGKNALAREFPKSHISAAPFQNGKPPADPAYAKLQASAFADWRLAVDGLVARPVSLSLAEIKAFPSRSQITHLACEEGWSFIAEWTGTPLATILSHAGALPNARFVVYRSIEPDWWDSVDIDEANHPQTLVTYGMNGAALLPGHGAPLRLRVPRQLGYKSVKYITRLTVTDDITKFGKGLGGSGPEFGYSWYSGI